MTREEKSRLIETLSEDFKNSSALVVCGFSGISHKELEELRKSAKEANVRIQVIKNSLAGIAIKNAEFEELELTGSNLFVWGEEQIATCKIADKFASSHKDNFEIKSGIIEGKAVDVNTINKFAKLPGREELLGMLANVWLAPVRNFTVGLDNLRKKKEEEVA